MKPDTIDRLYKKMPPTQAACRQGRSTTEHEFAAKVLTEKAVTSKGHPIYLLFLNTSKAFDTANRKVLLNDLKHTINADELHLISVMLGTKLQVQCGNSMSDIFATNKGVPQGDGMSVNKFTLYQAQALKKEHKDHSYARTHLVPQVISDNHFHPIVITVI